MSEIIVDLLPFIIGSAIAPGQIIIILLLLKTQQGGLIKGSLFYLGVTSIRLLQGIVFGLIMNPGGSPSSSEGKGPAISMLLLVLGILLLVTAYKKITKVPDPEDSPPKIFSSIDAASNRKAYFLGLQLPLISPKMWVFILSAIATISYAQPEQSVGISTFLLFIILAQLLLLLPIIIRILIPKRSITIFQSVSIWLNKNINTILIVVSLIFGSYFFYQGFSGLFG